MQRFLSVLLLLLGLTGFSSSSIPDDVTAEEYSVYSTLINTSFLQKTTRVAIIQASTEFDINAVAIPLEFEADLQTKIKEDYKLKRRFRIESNYLLLSDSQLDGLFKQDVRKGWDAYWKRYPHATGLLAFSRVGFNTEKNEAFVYASETCGALCGNGYAFVLTKENGSWRIKEKKQLWIS